MNEHSKNVIRTIRASADKVDAILERLDAAESPTAEQDGSQTTEWYAYRANGLVVLEAIGDILDLVKIFSASHDEPDHIYLVGVSGRWHHHGFSGGEVPQHL